MSTPTKKILQLTDHYLLPTYKRAPVYFSRGKGVYLWDAQGKKYLDLLAGVAVNALGHAHPKLVKALTKQTQSLIHCSNLFLNEQQALLAKELCCKTKMAQAFFCNSGTEAIEACIKFARYASLSSSSNRHEILVTDNSFHGRTLGALSATSQKKYQEGFGPLLSGFCSVPYGDVGALAQAITPQTCAILIEPIQGEGGVWIPPKGYLKQVRALCDQQGLFLILDEIQTGLGRTGRLLACDHEGIKSDILALAKGLGAGFPLGACLVSQNVAKTIKPGIHGSTFGGNPLACKVGLEVLSVVSHKGFLSSVKKQGVYFLKKLNQLQKKYSLIKSVRGLGLMLACELTDPLGAVIVEACLKKGLIINSIQDRILRFVPPLIITQKQIDEAMDILEDVLESVTRGES